MPHSPYEILQSLTLTYEEMLAYVDARQNDVLINAEIIVINISNVSSTSPVIKSDLGTNNMVTITEQGKKIVTEANGVGDSIVVHTIDNDRDYFIEEGDDTAGLFETN